MSIDAAAVALLIVLPVAFNVSFSLLARTFDYPGILRQPTDAVLHRFQAGGVRLKLVWYCFMLTAVAFAPLAVLVGQVLAREGHALVPLSVTFGVMAAVVQFLGLARWPFLVPHLARTLTDPATSETAREASRAVFDAFHRYLGVGVGECLGYLFTGVWTVLVGTMMVQSDAFAPWLGWLGVVVGAFLMIGSLEFVGAHEESGWKLAAVLVPFSYIAWSIWLIVAGVVLAIG